MSLDGYFPKDELEKWKMLFHEFQGKLFIDDKLTDAKVLLISIYMCCNKNQKAEVPHAEVKALFTNLGRRESNFNVNLSNLKKRGLVDEKTEKDTCFLYLKIEGLRAIKAQIAIATEATWLIESGKTFSAKKLFREVVLSNVGTYLKICDPYCGVRILDLLTEIRNSCRVFLLTQRIDKENEFKRELADFKKEFSNIDIEIRIFTANKLHDRYIITDNMCWSIGASLKDLGNKDTMITKLGEEIRQAIEETFEARWKLSAPLV